MHTVEALLKQLMRNRCRTDALRLALVDAIMESMPAAGERVQFEVSFKTRRGIVLLARDDFANVAVHPDCVTVLLYHIRCQHSTPKRRVLSRAVDCPTLPSALAELLPVFK